LAVGREVGGQAGVTADWDVLTNEMKRYEYQIGESGRITYGAPAGYHDDCVMALALANHRRWVTEGCGRMLPVVGIGGGGRMRRVRGAERVLVG
jgi:hypothetical protein